MTFEINKNFTIQFLGGNCNAWWIDRMTTHFSICSSCRYCGAKNLKINKKHGCCLVLCAGFRDLLIFMDIILMMVFGVFF